MKDGLLEIGDILYQWSRWHGLTKVSVVRLTEKQAVLSDGYKCLKAHRDGNTDVFEFRAIGDGYHYILENEKIKSTYEREQLLKRTAAYIRSFSEIKLHDYPNPVLSEIIKFVTPYISKPKK